MQLSSTPKDGFSKDLYSKAEAYFSALPNGKFATPWGLGKSAALLLLYAGTYAYFLLGPHGFPGLLGWAALLGVFHVLVPVNIAHDAIHRSLSVRPWINKLGLYGMEFTGANAYIYRKKHLEAHAAKEGGFKTDAVQTQGLLLQREKEDRKVNLPYLFYLLYAEYMIFLRDFRLFHDHAGTIPKKEWRKLYVGKSLYVAAFLVLPFVTIDLRFWQILVSLLLMYFTVTVFLVVILLMPTEKMESSRENESGYNDGWIREVLAQNVDFSPASRILNQLVGGANLNVVHYLFPDMHHVHYNRLARLIEETAREYGMFYRKQSVKDVIGIHLTYIRNIAQAETNYSAKAEQPANRLS